MRSLKHALFSRYKLGMNSASIITTIFAFVVGVWVHRRYFKGQPILFIIGGTLAFGEMFKWATGIETFPLKIFKTTRVGTQFDETVSTQIAKQSVSL
jgi:hypothetical protein